MPVQGGKLDVDEQGRPGRIRDEGRGEPPTVGRVSINYLVGQAVGIISLFTPPVILFAAAMVRIYKPRGGGRILGPYRKALTIGDDEVDVTDARRVDARVLHLA